MLDLQRLTVSYRNAPPTLKDVTLELSSGITALIGRNGAGKSTLLRAITGQCAYTGSILLDGIELSALSPQQRATRISLLPQILPAPDLCVRETVALGFSPHVTRLCAKEWETVSEILEKLQLAPLADRRVNTLSGGERQRVFLGMLLTQNTPILLLDEPTTYMDPSFLPLFYSILHEQREKGKTVLTVLHDVTEAIGIADRILLLENSALAFDGTPAECVSQCIPERAFGLSHYTAYDNSGTPLHFYKA